MTVTRVPTIALSLTVWAIGTCHAISCNRAPTRWCSIPSDSVIRFRASGCVHGTKPSAQRLPRDLQHGSFAGHQRFVRGRERVSVRGVRVHSRSHCPTKKNKPRQSGVCVGAASVTACGAITSSYPNAQSSELGPQCQLWRAIPAPVPERREVSPILVSQTCMLPIQIF